VGGGGHPRGEIEGEYLRLLRKFNVRKSEKKSTLPIQNETVSVGRKNREKIYSVKREWER